LTKSANYTFGSSFINTANIVGNMANKSFQAPPQIEDSAEPRVLKLAFFDLNSNPEDVSVWSGITAAMIQGLRNAGQQVITSVPVLPYFRKTVASGFWHYYDKFCKLHYIPDRHMFVTRSLSAFGNWKGRRNFLDADAIITTSTTSTAFLKTDKPIFVIHDATWGQVLELYPYFHPSKQVPHVVRGGFEMERQTFCRPDVTLVLTSDWAASRAIQDYDLDPSRVFVLPFGANFAVDPPRDEVERAIRARTGDHCNLLFVGREFDRKGGDIAVDATAALLALGIPATLHVVGCSPTDMPPWVNVYGLLRKDRPAELAQLHGLYAKCDFFILPTQAEAQGIVFNEAAAYGLPVAATNVGGVPSVVKDGDWGLLLETKASGEQYAPWLADLFRDREKYNEVAMRARQDYEARLSRNVYTQTLLTIIRGVLQKKAG
jgi:glycosyltransferase involved in cell wall biosynthesis